MKRKDYRTKSLRRLLEEETQKPQSSINPSDESNGYTDALPYFGTYGSNVPKSKSSCATNEQKDD